MLIIQNKKRKLSKLSKLSKQIRYLNSVCGIPTTIISSRTNIHYQHSLDIKNEKSNLDYSSLEDLESSLKKQYRSQFGI